MNMHITPQRTHAELALIEAFGERLSQLPGDGAIMLKRDAAIERIKAGLPTRHIEAWHYTDLRRLLTSAPAHDATANPRQVAPLLEGSIILPVLNGIATGSSPALDGVMFQKVKEKLVDGSFARALDPRDDDDVIGALNTAFVADGWFIDIAAGARIDQVLEIQNLHAGGQTHCRFPVRVGAGAKATIVERQTGSAAALTTSVSHLTVGDNAEILWIIVQDQPLDATHLAQFNAELGKRAKLTLFVMNIGGKLIRQEIRINAKGDGSDFQLRGVNLLGGDTHTDVTMVLDHSGHGATSRELVRNVVTDKARGVFQGRINVEPQAQKTDAKMACNTLLLSDEAEFSAKPELEIFADDVQCGHGATVTEIDANHLFYLMARGIKEKTAQGLLVKAFVASAIEELNEERIVEALEARLDDWFVTHG